MRYIWTLFGLFFVGLGVVGIFVPLLPTTVFILIAAFCFARGSDRLHDWLLDHKVFGPLILDWRKNGAIAPKAKRLATLSIIAVFLLSVFLNVPLLVLVLQALILSCILIFIWTRST